MMVSDENNEVIKDRSRDIELTRMRLLNPSMIQNSQRLSKEEVQAISAHLQANVPNVSKLVGHDPDAVKKLVEGSVVVETRRANPDENGPPVAPDVIYQRGKTATFCILILSGKVVVLAGKDQFRVELGPWSAIGQDALIMDDDTFSPDFSAYVLSPHLKYLKISKHTTHLIRRPPSVFPEDKMAKKRASRSPNLDGPLIHLSSLSAAAPSSSSSHRLADAPARGEDSQSPVVTVRKDLQSSSSISSTHSDPPPPPVGTRGKSVSFSHDDGSQNV